MVVDIFYFYVFIGFIFVFFIFKLLCNFVLILVGDWKFFDNSCEFYYFIYKYLV